MSEHTHLYGGAGTCLSRWGSCDAPVRPTPAPAQRGSATSLEAARLIEPLLGKYERVVLEAIRRAADGLTDEEGIGDIALNPSTYRPRRVRLVELGLVADSGTTRLTHSGRRAVVWTAI